MKLQRVLELTTLSKKAVYFYIKEDLISPLKNEENGYYDFSSEDLKRLQIITCLRKTGMSIQDIKELFLYPTLTNFFVHRQINNLKKSINEQINQLKASHYIVNEIPANATPINLEICLDKVAKQQLDTHLILDSYFPSVDARMIAILICAAFMDIESSEYHNFLWDKISNELALQLDNNLIFLKKLIYELSPQQIHTSSVKQYSIFKEITKADENALEEFQDILLQRCIELSQSRELQEYWKLVYDPILIPTQSFINSKAYNLLNEYNPEYNRYSKNMKIITSKVLKKLTENIELLECLNSKLDHKFNPENINMAELGCLFTFKESLYTQLKLEDLKKLLL